MSQKSPCNLAITYSIDESIPAVRVTLPKGVNMEYNNSKICSDPLALVGMTQLQNNAYGMIITINSDPSDYTQQNFVKISIIRKDEYDLKVTKQILVKESESIMLFEIYGKIENKPKEMTCVLCRCKIADRVLLPCRHLVICSTCINDFCAKAKVCPNCRTGKVLAEYRYNLCGKCAYWRDCHIYKITKYLFDKRNEIGRAHV